MANEPLAGWRYVKVTEQKTKKDWAHFIKEIADEHYPNALKIKLVMDNYGTHKPAALYDTFLRQEAKRILDRFDFIYTPKHGSCGAARAAQYGRTWWPEPSNSRY